VKLKHLLKKIQSSLILEVRGSKEINITGICSHSKQLIPGDLFIAKKGRRDSGSNYISDAVKSGASAIVTDIFDPTLDVTQIIYKDPKAIEAALADHFYNSPSNELLMIGITGTNGKTTTSFIIKTLLDHLNGPCGLIGTIEYIIGHHRYEATHTTPDVLVNQKMLREMVRQGCRSAVMEVSSHALDQGRVDCIDYDIAIFTNLTTDHLDYHHSMEIYCEAKSRLFSGLGKEMSKKKYPKVAIVNTDSPWALKIIHGCTQSVISYGIDQPADLMASAIQLGAHGIELIVSYKGESIPCFWPIVGRFNVYNGLAAIAAALSQNFPLPTIINKMGDILPIKGRLQPVQNPLGYQIFVDFAHSDDSLLNVLQSLKELVKGKIITVFGCGGDRDVTKRPKMAEASERYSDLSIVTSDNPRSEDPESICRDIIRGFKSGQSYIVELDRRLAIKKAIELATQDDIILIAGKGHETYQIFAHQTIQFDDSEVAAALCSEITQGKL
jgi:UDP-N-acetylmuramoyl-L-alanyl-D-glutamate--2,6-diaminopimelate ligase